MRAVDVERLVTTTKGDVLAAASTGILLVAAAAALIFPKAIVAVTGKADAARLNAPDEITMAAHDDDAPFLISRDTIEIRVGKAITLRQLLDLYRLEKPHQRKQVVEQLSGATLDAPIPPGTTLRIKLTPTTADVPGSPREAK
ncbi:MAG: hypothetical protein AABO58_07875 [Acidobacteriota bacterium]